MLGRNGTGSHRVAEERRSDPPLRKVQKIIDPLKYMLGIVISIAAIGWMAATWAGALATDEDVEREQKKNERVHESLNTEILTVRNDVGKKIEGLKRSQAVLDERSKLQDMRLKFIQERMFKGRQSSIDTEEYQRRIEMQEAKVQRKEKVEAR